MYDVTDLLVGCYVCDGCDVSYICVITDIRGTTDSGGLHLVKIDIAEIQTKFLGVL